MPTTTKDEFVAVLTPDEKPVSISTLKKKEIKKIMDAVSRGKDIANNYYTGTVEPKLIEREEIYLAGVDHYKKVYPALSEKCSWRSKDVKTLVDGIVPSLMEVFTGADSPVSVVGRNLDDDDKAKKVEALLKYDLTTKNDYTAFANDVLTDHLKLNIGIGKVWWKRDEERHPFQIMISPEDYAQRAYISAKLADGSMDIKKITPVDGGYYNIEYDEVEVKANYPVVEAIPPSEFRFTPESGNIQDCKFVAHRKIVTGDYLKRKEKEGIYENIDKAMKACGEARYTSWDTRHNKELNEAKYNRLDNDKASQLFELYECYLNVDYNNDGIYEKLIVHTLGDSEVPISIQKNEFDSVPFFVMAAERDPSVIFNDRCGYADTVEQQQDLKTAIIRQLIINVAYANSPRMAFDETKLDVEELLGDSPFLPVRSVDPARALYPLPQPTLSPNTMDIVEYAQNEIESQTGFTRYNNGLNSESLNKTATGITAILGQAEKRQKNLAKLDAELFFKPLFRFLIQLNQKYAEDETVIRVGDENVRISKEDLDVDYDLVLNVGQGAGTKEARINYLMILLQSVYPTTAQYGVVDNNTIYVTLKLLLDEMGLLSAEKSIVDPNSAETKQKQALAQQAALQSMQAQQQAELANKIAQINAKAKADIEKAKVPKVSVTMDDLPLDAQAQVMGNMGLRTSAAGMADKEARRGRASQAPRPY